MAVGAALGVVLVGTKVVPTGRIIEGNGTSSCVPDPLLNGFFIRRGTFCLFGPSIHCANF